MRGLIVAVSADGVIGVGGSIPWRYPLDMKRFKDVTMGTTVIMGSKTWRSIPERLRPLEGRRNIVLSSVGIPGAETRRSIPHALEDVQGDVWFIGGKRVYEDALALGVVDVADVTLVPDVVGDPSGEVVTLDVISLFRGWRREDVIHPDGRLGCVRYGR